MASGWNLWAWLQCIGVVSGCCNVVRRYIYVTVFDKMGHPRLI